MSTNLEDVVSQILAIRTGYTPVKSSSSSINWNTATATSGLAGGDLKTLGSPGVIQKIRYFKIDTVNLTAGAVVSVRIYDVAGIYGAVGKVYDDSFVIAADALGTQPRKLPILFNYLISDSIRVEFRSDTSEAKILGIEYQLEPA